MDQVARNHAAEPGDSTMQDLKTIDLETLNTVTGGSEAGDVCRDTYTAVGGVAGGVLTSESGGWGAIPGAVLGGMLGRAVCPK
jgi:hypothetical protein